MSLHSDAYVQYVNIDHCKTSASEDQVAIVVIMATHIFGDK